MFLRFLRKYYFLRKKSIIKKYSAYFPEKMLFLLSDDPFFRVVHPLKNSNSQFSQRRSLFSNNIQKLTFYLKKKKDYSFLSSEAPFFKKKKKFVHSKNGFLLFIREILPYLKTKLNKKKFSLRFAIKQAYIHFVIRRHFVRNSVASWSWV